MLLAGNDFAYYDNKINEFERAEFLYKIFKYFGQ